MNLSAAGPLLEAMRAGRPWWELKTLRALFEDGATALGHAFGPEAGAPEYAFLAVDTAGRKESAALLRLGNHAVLVCFQLGAREPQAFPAGLRGTVLLPGPPNLPDQGIGLAAVGFGDTPDVRLVWSVELAGARIGDRVVLFHSEPTAARSSVYFESGGEGRLKFLVTGLMPGAWEIWWNGWLEDPDGAVEPREGALYFEGRAGSYFIRRRG